MSSKETEIFQLIEPVCNDQGIFLSDISIHSGGKNTTVKVIVDTEPGVTLNQCQELSKKIADIFYRRDMFKGAYRLEVSSPGINKPLEQPYEYKRNIGKQLKVNYFKGKDECYVEGDLLAYNTEAITLNSDGMEILIPLKDIEQAKIKLKW